MNDVDCVGDADGAETNGEDGKDCASGGNLEDGVDYTVGADVVNGPDGADIEGNEHDAKDTDDAQGADGADGTSITGGGGGENYADILGGLDVEDNTICGNYKCGTSAD